VKYEALFVDFYGTLVHEDDIPIANITEKLSSCSRYANAPKEIAYYWWSEFRKLFEGSYGPNFKTQRDLETISIQKTVEHFQCKGANLDIAEVLFGYWVKPEIFEDTFPFLSRNTLPVCIVSNIDRNDILQAINFHHMNFDGIVTSEDAKSYKPRAEIFQLAMEKMKLPPHKILHIGDSLTSDILGANNCGIDSFWINRKKRKIPDNCLATYVGDTLLEVFCYLNAKNFGLHRYFSDHFQ